MNWVSLKYLLEKAGASFLRAFVVAVMVYVPGVLNAPNTSAAWALSIAAVYASLAAGLRAIQVLVPQLTTGNAIVDSFLRAFLGTLIASTAALLAVPDASVTKAALLGLLIGGLTAAVRAIQAVVDPGDRVTLKLTPGVPAGASGSLGTPAAP